MKHLQILAGAQARRHIGQHGLRPADVRAVAGAAGGPKGLVLNPLDRFVFGQWLAGGGPDLHLVGCSIGALRLACAAGTDADAALERFAREYIAEEYAPPAGQQQSVRNIGSCYAAMIERILRGSGQAILAQPRRRLHVVADRGRLLLRREVPGLTAVGFALMAVANAVHRGSLGAFLERVVFSDPRTELPLALSDLPTRRAHWTAANLPRVVLASGSIPFWFPAVRDIPGAPPGTYWDGGMTDYQLRWPWARIEPAGSAALVLYPHYEPRLVPGWLDKSLRRRHPIGSGLENVIMLAPSEAWVAALPGGRLPDRHDFARWEKEPGRRQREWNRALAQSAQLVEDFEGWLRGGCPLDCVRPLETE